METFKLKTNLRTDFKNKLKTRVNGSSMANGEIKVKQEPITAHIKKEPNTESISNLTEHKRIKTEKTTDPVIPMGWSTASSFDPQPKHEIIPQVKIKESTNSRRPSPKTCPTKSSKKPNPPKNHQRPRNRPPLTITAQRVLGYLSSRDPNTLTQKQLDSLTWAESVLLNKPIRRRASPATVVEIPAEGNNDQLNEAFITNETVLEIPDTLQLAVIDSTAPGGRYNLIQARLIEKNLSKAVIDCILQNPNEPQPLFGKSVYFDGVLVLDCKDQKTYEFAKLILSDMKLWPGSRLKLIEPERSPFDSIGCLHIPDVGIDKKLVLNVLKAQNPSINMSKWKILGETTYNKEGYKEYSILMANPPVYYQRHKQLRLYFGGSEVILKHFGCQWLWHCKV